MPGNIKLLYLINFFSALSSFSAIIVIYFVHITGSYTSAMTLLGSGKLFQAILEIPTGVFSDLIGRKNTTILAYFIGLIAIIFYAIGQNFWILMLGVFFGGLAGSLSSGNDNALMYDSLKEINKEEGFHHFYSRRGSIALVGYGLSAIIGGFVATISFTLALYIIFIPAGVAFVLSLFLHNPPNFRKIESNPYVHLKDAVKAFFVNPKLRMLSLSNAWGNSIIESTYQFSSVYVGLLWPLWAVGLMKASTNFLNAISYFISGKVIAKTSAFKALVGQFVVSRLVLIVGYILSNVFTPVIMASMSLLFGIGQVSQQTLLQKEFTDHQRATMGSLDSLLTSISFAVISLLVGFIADIVGPRIVLLLGEILLLPVLLVYWRLHLHNK
jgi:MFS family permease